MSTIRDVAKLAGVSIATVSRVLNGKGYVHSKTKLKVQNAVEELQFQPNSVAQGLASKKSGMIACVLPDITNPFFAELARAIEDAAKLEGYTVVICNSDDNKDEERNYIEILKNKYIDGIVIASQTIDKNDVAQLKNGGIPTIMLDRVPEDEDMIVIRAQNYNGAKLAVNHLLDIGCKKVAHIYGPQTIIPARERLKGFQDSVGNFEWYTEQLLTSGDFEIEGGMSATRELLKKNPDIDGIFAGNDLMAIGAIKVLLSMGIRVPEEVAVVGFDDISISKIIEPELSTVSQPIYEMGREAVNLLVKSMKNEIDIPRNTVFDVKLIKRGSTSRYGN